MSQPGPTWDVAPDPVVESPKPVVSRRPRRAILVLVLVGVVALAAGLRLYRLADFPPGLFIDQAQYGLDAWRISTGETFPVFVEGPGGNKERGREPLFMYLMAVVFLIAGPTPVTIKLTSALVGILTVALAYRAAASFLGERIGILTAALLAVARWHLTFSRMGFRAITTPLWVVLVVVALAALVRRPTTRRAALFGAVVGAGFYTYPAYWSVPPALGLVAAAALWRERHDLGGVLRRVRPLVLAGGAAFALAVAPLAIYAAGHADVLARARAVALPGGAGEQHTRDPAETTILDGAQRVLFMLHLRGDLDERHNIPGHPMLDRVSGLLFLAGLIAIARARWALPVKVGLVALWLLPLVPSAVTYSAPHALRTVGAIPAVCAIAAVGLDSLGRLIERWRGATAAAIGLLTVVLVFVTVANARAYFVEWGGRPSIPMAFSADIPRFVDYLREVSADADLVVCPYVYSSPNIRFLTLEGDPRLLPLDDVSALLAGRPATDTIGRTGTRDRATAQRRDRVFVCDEPATNALIHRIYPGAEEIGRYAVYEQRSGRVIRVPAAQLATRLPPAEEEQARYFVERMNASFAERSKSW